MADRCLQLDKNNPLDGDCIRIEKLRLRVNLMHITTLNPVMPPHFLSTSRQLEWALPMHNPAAIYLDILQQDYFANTISGQSV
jgi:hypothetical protein